eukprot:CAMPEP_0182569404 /NCGR_PEP_ID=MMETSP1324-20130603/10042_1 /TAXON_ID=236786 /ORGANISM="Florenciella sp., Strain RCC1587" /LENGTH=46 /DNA_ID= /DNA_START= /DNA_END= /DNA_ORIENTATION=
MPSSWQNSPAARSFPPAPVDVAAAAAASTSGAASALGSTGMADGEM